MQSIVVINDVHTPYHDKKVWRLFLRWIDDIKPDKIIINGDYWDCYSISSFDKDPTRQHQLWGDIKPGIDMLEELKGKVDDIEMTRGNHETRYRKFLITKAPALYTLPTLDFEEIFGLKRLHIPFHDKGIHLGKLYVTHGHLVRKYGGYTANAVLQRYFKSVMIGHTHRAGSTFLKLDDCVVGAWENACMCLIDDVEYDNADGSPNWTHGWSYVEVSDRGSFAVTPIVIPRDYRFISFGKEYFVRDKYNKGE